MSKAILKIALDHAVAALTEDLKVLSSQIPAGQPGLHISHDMTDLQVTGLMSLKAYVPKKYSGFSVVFKAVSPDELLSLTSTNITAAKHGLFA